MLSKLRLLFLTTFLFLVCVQFVATAQEDTAVLKEEIKQLKQGNEKLHEELRQIKELLTRNRNDKSAQAEVADVEFELGDNPMQGSDEAPLVIVEFFDYHCPFCSRHTQQTYPEIYEKYIKQGKVSYVFMDRPFNSNSIDSKAAEAAQCAAEQGKFWNMHEEMMLDSTAIKSINSLTELAVTLDLDINEFKGCMETKKYSSKISSNIALSTRLKIPSLPGFVIASRDPGNPQKVKGISFIRGAKPFEKFRIELDQALAGLKNK